jgi:DNA modification methylase
LGWSEIAVVWVEDDDAHAKAFALADNRTAELGSYDDEALLRLIEEVQLEDAELLEMTGWAEQDMHDLIEQLRPEPIVSPEDADEVPENVVARTVKGDVWILGSHRLMCGSSTIQTDIEKLLCGKKLDAILTDPPYGINLDTQWSKGGGRDYKKVANDDKPFDAGDVMSLIGDVDEQFWFGANYYIRSLTGSDLDGSWLVWDKRTENTDSVIGSAFELCWSKKKHQQSVLRYEWTNYTSHSNEGLRRAHPTEKPVKMLMEIINRWIPESAVIADFFGGSGTALVAAHLSNRTCYVMELDEHYCDVICARFQQLTGILPIAEATGNEHDFVKGV